MPLSYLPIKIAEIKPREILSCSRISSVGGALDCRTRGHGFDSGIRKKIMRNEGTSFALQAK